ncbi:NUDIX domain-containing protein [Candidatus Woesebacteria bacterium]|nr:NUDIX domain-containing protein [Candidatus Woesebacteria bacterium]
MTSNLGVPIILISNNRVLLGRRKNSYGEGLYGLPGGRVALNESLEHCMARELSEEVGVTPIDYRLLGIVKEWQKSYFFLHFVYLCTKWSGQIATVEPEKSEDWNWFSLDNLPLNILQGHKSGIAMVSLPLNRFQLIEL